MTIFLVNSLERDTEIDWRGCPHSLLRIILFSFTSYIYEFLLTATTGQSFLSLSPSPLPYFLHPLPRPFPASELCMYRRISCF